MAVKEGRAYTHLRPRSRQFEHDITCPVFDGCRSLRSQRTLKRQGDELDIAKLKICMCGLTAAFCTRHMH